MSEIREFDYKDYREWLNNKGINNYNYLKDILAFVRNTFKYCQKFHLPFCIETLNDYRLNLITQEVSKCNRGSTFFKKLIEYLEEQEPPEDFFYY